MKLIESDMKVGLRKLLKEWIDDQRCAKQSAMRDLLTDLRHICDEEKVDFYRALDGAYQVYREEVAERLAKAKGK